MLAGFPVAHSYSSSEAIRHGLGADFGMQQRAKRRAWLMGANSELRWPEQAGRKKQHTSSTLFIMLTTLMLEAKSQTKVRKEPIQNCRINLKHYSKLLGPWQSLPRLDLFD